MSPRLKFCIIFLILIVLLLAGRTRTAPAISQRDSNIIEIAFENGYLAALKLDPAEMEILKKDNTLLRQTVEKAAAQYLKVISTMNGSQDTQGERGSKTLHGGKADKT